MTAKPPRLDGDQIAAHVAALSREPFRRILNLFLEAAPGIEDVANLARRQPDRYVQALVMLGKLGGFHERMQVDHSHEIHSVAISQMSDAELMNYLSGMLEKMGFPIDRLPDPKALPALTNGSGAGEAGE